MTPRSLRPLAVLPLLLGVAAAGPAGAGEVPDDAATTPATTTARTVLVLDSSGSMAEDAGGGQTRIEAAKDALGRVVDALPEDAEVGVRVFGATVLEKGQPGACTDSQQVVVPATGNRDALRAAVAAYTPYGETPIAHALREAAQDVGTEGPRSIVLVSDGIATCAPDPCRVAAEIREQGIDLRIDVVGVAVDASARSQLRCVAARGGGTYTDAASADEIVDSLTTAAQRALRPFAIDGEPVVGGPDQTSATPITAGRWADRLEPGEEETWFRYERTMPGSTVVASSYEMSPGLLVDTRIEVVTTDGRLCTGGATPVIHQLFTGYARIASAAEDERCGADTLFVHLERQGSSDDAEEVGFGVVEVPPITDAAALPAAADDAEATYTAPQPVTPAEPVVAGTSFADAVVLTSGRTYAATVVPGEVQAFAVEVGWGQRLAVRVDRPALTPEVSRAGASGLRFGLQLLNPVRATINDTLSGTDDSAPNLRSTPTSQLEGTLPVRWSNQDTSTTALAGTYYVAYGAGDTATSTSVELPYTITVEVQGEVTGAPTYADGAEVVTAPPSPSPTPSPSAPSSPAGASDQGPAAAADGRAAPLVPVVGGLVLAVALVGALAWWRRRRRA